ncbi:hypothetical protein [Burkholderia territorii]|uniref:hypothetical protein n=1 Tax=Burkholderia territorii TaxID=1503055 RepID=UPI0009BCB8ED|nr:hypothetical protein [Burkholderia territorii]
MNLKIIEDGNLSEWFRVFLIAVGIAFVAIAVGCDINPTISKVLLLSGFAVALVGGVASRAKLLNIKPFGQSAWRKAKKTYEKDE